MKERYLNSYSLWLSRQFEMLIFGGTRDFGIPSEVEGLRSITFGCSAEFLDYASLHSE